MRALFVIHIIVFGAVLSILGVILLISRQQSAQSPGIVFMSERDGDAEIYVMRPDGSQQRRLTDRPGRDGAPIPSPAGKWLVFASKLGGGWQLQGLSLFAHQQNALPQMSNGDLRDPVFSPDGQRLYGISNYFVGDGTFRSSVMAIHFDRGGAAVLNNTTTQKTRLSVSPDGQWLTYGVPQNGLTDQLFLMRTNGSAHTSLTQTTGFNPAQWSPDSRSILMVTAVEGNWDIQRWVIGENAPEILLDSPFYEWNPHLSRDGQWLIFQTNRDGNTEIYRMKIRAAERDIERLTQDAGEDYIADFSPDGAWILYTNDPDGPDGHTPDIWKMRLNGTERTQLTFTAGIDNAPAWLPIFDLPLAGGWLIVIGGLCLLVGKIGYTVNSMR